MTNLKAVLQLSESIDQREPRFGYFHKLHCLNLLELERQLDNWQEKYDNHVKDLKDGKDGKGGITSLDGLPAILKSYCQAARDWEYMRNLNSLDATIAATEQNLRKNKFRQAAASLPDHEYKTFLTPYFQQPDRLLDFMRKHLPESCIWADRQAQKDVENYSIGEHPKGYSVSVKLIASLIITLAASLWLIVPVVLMTIPKTVSVAWNLSTLAIAIALFGGFSSVLIGPEPTTRDVVGATAAYAAVLVVFYGNILTS